MDTTFVFVLRDNQDKEGEQVVSLIAVIASIMGINGHQESMKNVSSPPEAAVS